MLKCRRDGGVSKSAVILALAPALVIAVFALLNTGSVSGQKTASLSFDVATVRISPGGFPTYTGGPGSGRDIERLT